MIHAREDYNRIQDPENKIGEDEPVFLLRAQDRTAPATLRAWANMQRQNPKATKENIKAAELAMQHASEMERWQEENGVAKWADV